MVGTMFLRNVCRAVNLQSTGCHNPEEGGFICRVTDGKKTPSNFKTMKSRKITRNVSRFSVVFREQGTLIISYLFPYLSSNRVTVKRRAVTIYTRCSTVSLSHRTSLTPTRVLNYRSATTWWHYVVLQAQCIT